MRVLALAVLVALTAATALARDIFVDNAAGDDLNDGRTQQSGAGTGPVRSLRKALLVAQPGDRIVLTDSGIPYRESIGLSSARHCGNGLRPFIVDGRGATLDGSVPVPEDAWEHFQGDVFRFRPQRMSYQQLFLDAKPLVRRKVDPAEGELPELAPREWYLHEGYIHFRIEPDRLPEDYDLWHAGLQTGITLYQVHDVAILDLVVQGFQLDGINAHDGVRDAYLAGVTSRGNGRAGIAVGGASHVHLEACLVGDNGAAQLLAGGRSITVLENCELIPNTAPAIVRQGGRIISPRDRSRLGGNMQRTRNRGEGTGDRGQPEMTAGRGSVRLVPISLDSAISESF